MVVLEYIEFVVVELLVVDMEGKEDKVEERMVEVVAVLHTPLQLVLRILPLVVQCILRQGVEYMPVSVHMEDMEDMVDIVVEV